MKTVDSAPSRSIPDRRTLAVVGVDVLALIALISVGQLEHGINPLADPLAAAETVTPFLIGWALLGTLAGVYRERALAVPRQAVVATTVGWIGAANIGLILRSSPLFDGGALWPFNLIMTALGLVVLVGWRLGLSVALAK